MELYYTNRITYLLILVLSAIGLSGCGGSQPSIPEQYVVADSLPTIYPDYVGVTVPCNIAPLNFAVLGGCESCVAELKVGNKTYLYGGDDVRFDEKEWHHILNDAKGDSILVSLYVKNDREWTLYNPFHIVVSPDSVDRYLSYRLIPPSYTMYEKLSICQRDLSTFEERVLYTNTAVDSRSTTNHCINCHSFQANDTKRWQFHVRESHGGTVIVDGNKVVKRDMKRPNTLGAGVYPAWHPTLNLIAYSTNKTMQHFHTADQRKVEVQDSRSDLILYDVDRDSVVSICNTPMKLEVFPSWSPDGKYLYYCMAQIGDSASLGYEQYQLLRHDDNAAKDYVRLNYRDIRYDIYRRSFDPESCSFSDAECVIKVSQDSLSLTVPRISPDGRFLLSTVGPYGCFHIWHPEADLMLTDLGSGESHRLARANSDRAESFHNWSSNGRWIAFTSRRDDGNYTRLYLTHIDAEGNDTKAMMIPQENPMYEHFSTLSYNVPELTINPVTTTLEQIANVIEGQ